MEILKRPAKAVTLKVLVIGESNVGKTSLTMRLVRDYFQQDSTAATVNFQMATTSIDLDGISVQFDIWDTAGSERYRAVMPTFYRNADCALIVFDVTEPQSLLNVPQWLNEIRRHSRRDDVVNFIVANKVDLRTDDNEDRCVSSDELRRWARQHGLQCIETSAKTAHNVRLAFESVAKLSAAYQDALTELMDQRRLARSSVSDVAVSTVVLDKKQASKKSSCCS